MSKINELLDLLDQNENIKEIEVLKNKISSSTIALIKEYQLIWMNLLKCLDSQLNI